MKRKIYTLSHNINLLKEIGNADGWFTAEEHAYVIEKEFGETIFRTREKLFRSYLSRNFTKLGALGFLIDFIKRNDYRNILSLGAGECVMEYLLKMALPEESQVVACDFNSFFVKKTKEFFPEIIVERFDFFNDDIMSLKSKLNIEFDLVVFFSSSYVMDDAEFIKLFGGLKKIGAKHIIDFHGAYMSLKDAALVYFEPFRMSPIIRKIFRKPPLTIGGYHGKFHGYLRNRGELRRLYKNSGLEVQKEISAAVYRYVAILR